VADKPTSELISGTGNQTVITIEFDREVNRGLLKNVAGVIEANPAGGFTWEIIASEKADVRAALFQFAVKNNLQVLTIQKSEQKLEDIFKQLTR
jgi:ABC-2 type transport system ATP-binding protein